MSNPFCPLYKEAQSAQPWKDADTANSGLLFDKFAHAWDWKRNRGQPVTNPPVPAFDIGAQDKKDKDKAEHEKQGYWLRKFPDEFRPSSKLLDEACQRQRDLVTALGGVFLRLKNTNRFVTGMGREHPVENGFTFHHTLGVPYLPGSSLKGALRAWLREERGAWDPNANKGNGRWVESKQYAQWFGSQDAAGRFILLDMLPTAPPALAVDVMTPHYGPYYQEGKIPGDWHSPVPIQFLTVKTGNSWQLGIIPAPGKQPLGRDEIEGLSNELINALQWLGAGAKTAVGYGRFEHDSGSEEELRRETESRREASARAKRLAALTDEQRNIDELRTLLKEQRQYNQNDPGSPLAERFRQLLTEAQTWPPAEQTEFAAAGEEVLAFLKYSRKKQKEYRAQLQRLQGQQGMDS